MLAQDKSAAADAVLGKRPKIDVQPRRGVRGHSHGGPFILSDRGPRRTSAPGSPMSGLCYLGWRLGGGESKDLRLLFGIYRMNFRVTTLGRLRSLAGPFIYAR
jgi:hypothetical protein